MSNITNLKHKHPFKGLLNTPGLKKVKKVKINLLTAISETAKNVTEKMKKTLHKVLAKSNKQFLYYAKQFFDFFLPCSAKPLQSRMGKGKGNIKDYVAPITKAEATFVINPAKHKAKLLKVLITKTLKQKTTNKLVEQFDYCLIKKNITINIYAVKETIITTLDNCQKCTKNALNFVYYLENNLMLTLDNVLDNVLDVNLFLTLHYNVIEPYEWYDMLIAEAMRFVFDTIKDYFYPPTKIATEPTEPPAPKEPTKIENIRKERTSYLSRAISRLLTCDPEEAEKFLFKKTLEILEQEKQKEINKEKNKELLEKDTSNRLRDKEKYTRKSDLQTYFSLRWNKLNTDFHKFTKGFLELIPEIKNIITNIITNFITNITNFITNFITNITNFITNFITNITNFITNTFSGQYIIRISQQILNMFSITKSATYFAELKLFSEICAVFVFPFSLILFNSLLKKRNLFFSQKALLKKNISDILPRIIIYIKQIENFWDNKFNINCKKSEFIKQQIYLNNKETKKILLNVQEQHKILQIYNNLPINSQTKNNILLTPIIKVSVKILEPKIKALQHISNPEKLLLIVIKNIAKNIKPIDKKINGYNILKKKTLAIPMKPQEINTKKSYFFVTNLRNFLKDNLNVIQNEKMLLLTIQKNKKNFAKSIQKQHKINIYFMDKNFTEYYNNIFNFIKKIAQFNDKYFYPKAYQNINSILNLNTSKYFKVLAKNHQNVILMNILTDLSKIEKNQQSNVYEMLSQKFATSLKRIKTIKNKLFKFSLKLNQTNTQKQLTAKYFINVLKKTVKILDSQVINSAILKKNNIPDVYSMTLLKLTKFKKQNADLIVAETVLKERLNQERNLFVYKFHQNTYFDEKLYKKLAKMYYYTNKLQQMFTNSPQIIKHTYYQDAFILWRESFLKKHNNWQGVHYSLRMLNYYEYFSYFSEYSNMYYKETDENFVWFPLSQLDYFLLDNGTKHLLINVSERFFNTLSLEEIKRFKAAWENYRHRAGIGSWTFEHYIEWLSVDKMARIGRKLNIEKTSNIYAKFDPRDLALGVESRYGLTLWLSNPEEYRYDDIIYPDELYERLDDAGDIFDDDEETYSWISDDCDEFDDEWGIELEEEGPEENPHEDFYLELHDRDAEQSEFIEENGLMMTQEPSYDALLARAQAYEVTEEKYFHVNSVQKSPRNLVAIRPYCHRIHQEPYKSKSFAQYEAKQKVYEMVGVRRREYLNGFIKNYEIKKKTKTAC